MMHECKRLLNHSTAAEGLLLASSSTQRAKATSMDAFIVPQPTDADADADSDATERTGSDDAADEDGGAPKKQRGEATVGSEEQRDNGSEPAESSEDDCDEALPPEITNHDAAGTVADATGKKQVFTKSLAHRDDWLHRGNMLRDMDYYHYSRFVERVEMPRSGSAQSFQKHHGVYYLFDRHYPLAKTYVQILRKHAKTVQNVGPQCKRSDVNGGEDNAVYKAYFHSCVQCPGAEQCANPLMYQQLLYPRIDDVDKYLALLQNTPDLKRKQTRFAPAWKARRAELEVLADRAAEKHDKAKRIGVIHDTTSFKGVRIPRTATAPDAATEYGFEVRMRQVLIQQAVLHTMKG